MQMKSYICPKCGTKISMLPVTEYCFCTECGTKIVADAAAEAEEPSAVSGQPAEEPAEEELSAVSGQPTEEATETEAAEATAEEAPEEEPTAVSGQTSAEAPEAEAAEEPSDVSCQLSEEATAEEAPEEEPAAVSGQPSAEAPEAEAAEEPAAVSGQPSEEAPVEEEAAPEAPVEVTFGNTGAEEEQADEEEKKPVPPLTTGIQAADEAFAAGKYEKALALYSHAKNDPGAMFRAGLSAVYSSKGAAIPLAEFKIAVTNAQNSFRAAGNEDFPAQKDAELTAMLLTIGKRAEEFAEKLPSQEDCVSQTNAQIAVVNLFQTAIPFLTGDDAKEEALHAGVQFCSAALRLHASYFAGTETDKKGRVRDRYEPYRPESKQKDMIRSAKSRMTEQYNTLGSRVEREKRLTGDVKELKAERKRLNSEIDSLYGNLKKERKTFYAANPEAKKSRSGLLVSCSLIIAAVALVLGGMAGYGLKLGIVWLFIVLLLLALVFVFFAVRVLRRSLTELEIRLFPAGMSKELEALVKDKKALRQCRRSLSDAEEALIKFNSSRL